MDEVVEVFLPFGDPFVLAKYFFVFPLAFEVQRFSAVGSIAVRAVAALAPALVPALVLAARRAVHVASA